MGFFSSLMAFEEGGGVSRVKSILVAGGLVNVN